MMTAEEHGELGLMPPSRRVAIPGAPQDIASVLDATLASDPDREALVGRHSRYTYSELDAAANAAAQALAERGVRQGVRIAAALGNHPEAVIAFLAAQRLDAVWVGINPALTANEMTRLLGDTTPEVLLLGRAALGTAAPLCAAVPAIRSVIGVAPGESDCEWHELISGHAGAARPPAIKDPFRPAAISFTSGTTGSPKGAVHSQHGIMVASWTANAGMRGDLGPTPSILRRGTVGVMALNAMISGMLIPFAGGGAGICLDRRDAEGIVDWIERERIAVLSLATPVIYDLVHVAPVAPERLSSLRFVTSLGSPIPEDLRLAFEARYSAAILAGYGQTEAPGPIAGASFDQPPQGPAAGPAHRHVELAILDPQHRPVPLGEAGEICVRAIRSGPWAGVYTPMLGYWKRPKATAEALRNEWLHTGDIGTIDSKGHVTIKDRLHDMILRGGANVYPAEIEQVILRDPRVQAVAVIGRPDERLGERVTAFVQPAPGAVENEALAKDLRALCASCLARYKVPDDWRFVSEFPRGATEKILKGRLRQIHFGR